MFPPFSHYYAGMSHGNALSYDIFSLLLAPVVYLKVTPLTQIYTLYSLFMYNSDIGASQIDGSVII
jgi:hypothetical protein